MSLLSKLVMAGSLPDGLDLYITSEEARAVVQLLLCAEKTMEPMLTQLRHYPGDVETRKLINELHAAIQAIREGG